MQFVFVSRRGDILPLANRVEEEGHNVAVYICPNDQELSDKLITQSGPDVIIFDSPGFGKVTSRLIANDFPVLGSSIFSDQLPDDKPLNICGIPTVEPTDNFQSQVSVEGWFNGNLFTTIVYTSSHVSLIGSKSDVLYKESLGKLVTAIKKARYVGPVSLECFFDDKHKKYATLSACFTKNTMLTIKEGLKGRVADLLFHMATGVNRVYTFKPMYYASIELLINSTPTLSEPITTVIQGFAPDNLKHIWLYNVTKGQDGSYVHRGFDNRLGVVTARGDTVREARRRVYRTIYSLKAQDLLFLSKVGNKASTVFAQLKSYNYI